MKLTCSKNPDRNRANRLPHRTHLPRSVCVPVCIRVLIAMRCTLT